MAGQPNQAPVTGAASSRRTRRRLLADAFDRGERTFGDAEDTERLHNFLARGRAVGGQAGQHAEARAGDILALAMPWPVARTAFLPWRFDQLVEFSRKHGVSMELKPRPDCVAYLTLSAHLPEFDSEEHAETNLAAVFWAVFASSTYLTSMEALESLVVPRAWAPKLNEPPTNLSFVPLFDTDAIGRGSYLPVQGRRMVAEAVAPYVGSVTPQVLCGPQELTRMFEVPFDVNMLIIRF